MTMQQKEIKFRAWLIKEKKWYDMDITDSSNIGVLNVNFEYILCQYIGLKDKNGKEIYEGDIIGFDEFDYDERKDYIDYYVVCFGRTHDERYGYFLQASNTQKVFYTEFSKGIVRGNIYANPELIK